MPIIICGKERRRGRRQSQFLCVVEGQLRTVTPFPKNSKFGRRREERGQIRKREKYGRKKKKKSRRVDSLILVKRMIQKKGKKRLSPPPLAASVEGLSVR